VRRFGVAVLALAVAAAGAAAVALAGGDEDEPAAASTATATAKIVRKDLTETEEADGMLGYTDERAVTGRKSGTVTRLPDLGDVVATNHTLYEVDGAPVFLLNGTTPAYRGMSPGTDGDDVAQLERNLRDLGLDPHDAMVVDGAWDDGTTAAVQRWQERKGLAEDGTIELGQVVFLPGDRRISELPVPVGAADAGQTPVLKTTSTRRRVTVDLEASRERLAERGATVEVELPDGESVDGVIEDVGRVAESEAAPDGTESDPTIELTIRLRDAPRGLLDQAPVDVRLKREGADDVLTVPVTALLARSGGGYALEVHAGGRRRLVPVDPGVFADGDVEIRGEGLREGMTVSDARV
jgi:membrane fusion protein, multidrug efflux system